MVERPASDRRPRLRERRLERREAGHAFGQKPIAVDHEEARRRFAFRQADVAHGRANQAGDAAAGGACAEHGHTLLGERDAGDIDGRQQGASRHRRRALHVVVEG